MGLWEFREILIVLILIISFALTLYAQGGPPPSGQRGRPATGPAGRNIPRQYPKDTPKPDFEEVSYGPGKMNVLDVWKFKGDKPAPALVYIHGGGFCGGDKTMLEYVDVARDLASGLTVVAINYRLTGETPYPAQMHDCVRAIQFIRLNAAKFNIDPARIALTGVSAGAGISFWIAFHDDMADPKSTDPVCKMSSRVSCVLVYAAQCTYDPREVKKIVPGNAYNIPEIKALYGKPPVWDWDKETIGPELDALIKDSSPLTYLTKDDPPVYVMHLAGAEKDGNIHHPNFGRHLEKKMQEVGVECVWRVSPTDYQKLGTSMGKERADFLKKHLKIE